MNIEEKIKAKLSTLGFDERVQFNQRFLIGATINETILALVRNLRTSYSIDVSDIELQKKYLINIFKKMNREHMTLLEVRSYESLAEEMLKALD